MSAELPIRIALLELDLAFGRFRRDRRAMLAQIRLNELQASLNGAVPESTLRRIQRLSKGINRRIAA